MAVHLLPALDVEITFDGLLKSQAICASRCERYPASLTSKSRPNISVEYEFGPAAESLYVVMWPICQYVLLARYIFPCSGIFTGGRCTGLGSIIFGYDLGVIAGVLPAPDFIVSSRFVPFRSFLI